MNSSQLGGVARARSLSADERSRIARKAARARWADKPGILSREEIKRQVVKMLEDRSEAVAYLFGSYARGEARVSSDVDLLVVEKKMAGNRYAETALLRHRLTFDRAVDLIVVDEENFNTWKNSYGTVQHVAFSEGVRLV
jgi:predicted nucleotidyltransferase